MRPQSQDYLNSLLERWPPGQRVLELGANADSARGFARVLGEREYVGIDLLVTPEDERLGIRQGDANRMDQFDDDSFDAIVTSSMFEHDRYFWRTLAEVRRVLCPGGRFYVGVPGYPSQISTVARYAREVRKRLDARGMVGAANIADLLVAARTYPMHMEPNDFYRFSVPCMREVLLEGFEVLEVQEVMTPPRIQAVGQLPMTD